MKDGKRLYTFVEVDDSVSIQKLPILDQLRILFRSLTYDETQELANEDIVTKEYLMRKANLLEFLRKATAPIRSGTRKEVIVNISSEFNPVYNEVIRSPEIQNYYYVSEVRPHVGYGMSYDFMVRLRVKKR